MADPITSSADMVTSLQQQLADIAEAKSTALETIAAVIVAGIGPDYTISSAGGSETMNMQGYLTYLRGTIVEFVKLERDLLEMLQSLQPFIVRQHATVRGKF